MSDDFWEFLDRLIARSRMVIDRTKGTCHSRYPELAYPLDYGTSTAQLPAMAEELTFGSARPGPATCPL